MTGQKELQQILELCEAGYAMRQAEFARIIAQENRIRQELGRLDAMQEASRAPTLEHLPMRAIGADVIWHGWLGQSKTALNIALAKVLAVKETHIAEVRRAFGKLTAVKHLLKEDQSAQNSKLKRSVLAAAVEMSLAARRDQ